VGQLCPLAPNNAADQRGEGRQVPSPRARELARISL
jgi:hypothetical protein